MVLDMVKCITPLILACILASRWDEGILLLLLAFYLKVVFFLSLFFFLSSFFFFRDALGVYQLASLLMELDTSDEASRILCADALYQMGWVEEAHKLLSLALSRNPQRSPILARLALLQLKKGFMYDGNQVGSTWLAQRTRNWSLMVCWLWLASFAWNHGRDSHRLILQWRITELNYQVPPSEGTIAFFKSHINFQPQYPQLLLPPIPVKKYTTYNIICCHWKKLLMNGMTLLESVSSPWKLDSCLQLSAATSRWNMCHQKFPFKMFLFHLLVRCVCCIRIILLSSFWLLWLRCSMLSAC